MGVLMLVAPHQFSWPAFAWLQDQPTGWGIAFIAAGVGLLTVVTLAPRFDVVVLAHLLAGALLLALAAGFIRIGAWGGAAAYLVLGLGTALAPVLGRLDFQRTWLRVDALSLLLGFGALVTGMIMLASPEQYAASRYDLVRPFLAVVWTCIQCVGAPGVPQPAEQAGPSLDQRCGAPTARQCPVPVRRDDRDPES